MPVYRFAGVEYLIGVNPAFTERADVVDEGMDGNKVDARWMDMQPVLYIDITALSMHRDEGGKQIMFGAKNGHAYHREHVTPLQRSAFVGLHVHVHVHAPVGTERMLPQEYAESALTVKVFRRYEL